MAKKASKPAAKKKTSVKKNTETAKKPASRKTAAKKAPAKKSSVASKAKTPAAPGKTKKSAASDDGRILFRRFDTAAPASLYQPEPDAAFEAGFSAPPFFSRKPRNYKKIMSRKFDFDLAEVAAAGPDRPKKARKAASKKPAVKKAPADIAASTKMAEEEARRKAEEEARRKAEEEARRKAEEEARRKAEEEARRKAEEEARRKAEEEARRKAEEEARRKAEEEARRKAEEEARRKAEEEARRKAEEEARRKAEEEARRKAEEEARRKAEEEARRKAEEEARRKAEEEARRKAEEEARRIVRKKEAEKKTRIAGLEKEIADREVEVARMKTDHRRRFRPLVYSAAGLGLIMSMVTVQSYRNQGRFYIENEGRDRVEVRQGLFSPLGDRLLTTLPVEAVPAERKDVYGKMDVYGLLYEYYLGVADESLASADDSTLENVKKTLSEAARFALAREDKELVRLRMVRVDLMMALSQADMAAARDDLKGALSILRSAMDLDLNDRQAEMVSGKIKVVEKLLNGDEQEPAAVEGNAFSRIFK